MYGFNGGYPQFQQQYPQQYQQQYQQYQPTWQPRQIQGRTVSSPDEITVQDVPSDGSLALFPSSDGSCIYGKRWESNGSISTCVYVQQQVETERPDRIQDISDKLDTCERLAWLYIVRDSLLKKRVAELPDTRSDFLRAAAEAPTDSLLMVLDEHMDAIKVIYPQEYEKLVERIRKLSQD